MATPTPAPPLLTAKFHQPAAPRYQVVRPALVARLNDRLAYAGITGRLVVRANTVRFHVREIYGKLGVNRQAQARELGLL